MRLNQFLAKHTNLSRRSADVAIEAGRVAVNGAVAELGQAISESDEITLDNKPLQQQETVTIMLHKPVKTICSKTQQGNVPTVYRLLPDHLQHLTYIGRLDKDTSGLLIMSNNGDLIQQVSHPSHEVEKQYEVQLSTVLGPQDLQTLQEGIQLDDGVSKLGISGKGRDWTVIIHEGRNRQIRRSFEALGYEVSKLERVRIGNLELGNLPVGQYQEIESGAIS